MPDYDPVVQNLMDRIDRAFGAGGPFELLQTTLTSLNSKLSASIPLTSNPSSRELRPNDLLDELTGVTQPPSQTSSSPSGGGVIDSLCCDQLVALLTSISGHLGNLVQMASTSSNQGSGSGSPNPVDTTSVVQAVNNLSSLIGPFFTQTSTIITSIDGRLDSVVQYADDVRTILTDVSVVLGSVSSEIANTNTILGNVGAGVTNTNTILGSVSSEIANTNTILGNVGAGVTNSANILANIATMLPNVGAGSPAVNLLPIIALLQHIDTYLWNINNTLLNPPIPPQPPQPQPRPQPERGLEQGIRNVLNEMWAGLQSGRIEGAATHGFRGLSQLSQMAGNSRVARGATALFTFFEIISDSIGKLRDFANNLHQANMQFAEYSPAMSMVQARQQIRDITLSMQRGERRAGAAEEFAEFRHKWARRTAVVEDWWDMKKQEILMKAGGALEDPKKSFIDEVGDVKIFGRPLIGDVGKWAIRGLMDSNLGALAYSLSGKSLGEKIKESISAVIKKIDEVADEWGRTQAWAQEDLIDVAYQKWVTHYGAPPRWSPGAPLMNLAEEKK